MIYELPPTKSEYYGFCTGTYYLDAVFNLDFYKSNISTLSADVEFTL